MLGETAGRSPQHRQRGTARRRFSVDERTQNTPLPDDPQEWPDQPRSRTRMIDHIADVILGLLSAGLTLLCIALYVHVPDWRGMFALGFLVSYTALGTLQIANNHRNR
jgi:hypothetical protein